VLVNLFKLLEKARCSGKSGTSTKKRVRLSRYEAPSCPHSPCTIWVSHDAAPNFSLDSAKVCASNCSGMGLPSLNSTATRISYPGNELKRSRAYYRELDSLVGQKAQRLRRHCCLARSPTLARTATDDLAQRSLLGFFVWKPN
jgi:hypothetical protein